MKYPELLRKVQHKGIDSHAIFSAEHLLHSALRQSVCQYHLYERLIGHVALVCHGPQAVDHDPARTGLLQLPW